MGVNCLGPHRKREVREKEVERQIEGKKEREVGNRRGEKKKSAVGCMGHHGSLLYA